MTARPYLSIGEVLGLLLEEFPDITISKIRFLETQGLIDPERTPSGYRKFYDDDLDRLRFILREQKDHYLPLRVIKERLDTTDDTLPVAPRPHPTGASWARAVAPAGEPETNGARSVESDANTRPRPDVEIARAAATTDSVVLPAAAMAPDEPGLTESSTPDAPIPGPGAELQAESGAESEAEPAPAPVHDPAPDPVPAGGPTAPVDPGAAHPAPVGDPDDTGRRYDAAEVCALAGITRSVLAELESYGLVTSTSLGGGAVFGGGALRVARLAARLGERGLEVRHLRTWKMNADREVALVEQLVVPLVRQRNPQARQQAAATAAELASLGAELRAALVRQALSPYLDAAP